MLLSRNGLKKHAHLSQAVGIILHCLVIIALYPTAGHANPDSAGPQLRIYAAIAPLSSIIKQIGGPHLSVETLLPPGQDPHLFEPGPRLLHSLSKADMYLMSGLPFERMLVQKITARQKQLTVIDLSTKISFWQSNHHLAAHNCLEDPTNIHDHSGRDPHFWLGVHQLRQFITAAARSICDADPAHVAMYQNNTARLLARLDSVHRKNEALLQPYRSRIFFAYHPAFGYFTRTYNLQQQTVENDGQKPGPRTIAALIKKARAANVHTIFVQPQYDTKSAQAIATAINGTVLPLDPLAEDAIQNLETMAQAIARAFKQEPDQP